MNYKQTATLLSSWRRSSHIVITAALLLFSALFCMSQEAEQSLGDVARQKKPERKAARVVTNDEIPSVTPIAQLSAPTGVSDTEKATANDAKSSNPAAPKDKSANASKSGITIPGLMSNGSVQQAQTLLESLKQDRQKLLDNYDKIEKKLAETNDDSLRRVYSDSMARRNETLARNDKAIADTESAIHAAQAADAQGDKQ
jgi:hypothetical protein